MNDKMLDIIGLADEAYLREAESQPARQITHRRRFSAGLVAAAAAAAVMTVTAGAVTVAKLIHKESVDYYYNEEMASEMELRGYASGQVTENEHVRMTLENLLVDENYAYGVVTVECLDNLGSQAFGSVPGSYAFDSRGNYLEYKTDSYLISMLGRVVIGENNSDRSKQAYMLQVYLRDPYSQVREQIPDKLRIFFGEHPADPGSIKTENDIPAGTLEGLSFDISTVPNVNSVKLVSENGRKAVISEFMFDFRFDPAGITSSDHYGWPGEMTLCFSDGSRRTLYSNDSEHTGDISYEAGSKGVINDPEWDARGRFERLQDISGLVSVEFAGEVYKVIN